MPQSDTVNRQWILNRRPKGEPDADTLKLIETDVPQPGPGEMLLRAEYLSLDPYMRGRMSDAPSYAEPVEIGGVMVGGTVSRVVASQLDGFAEGDWVLNFGGWQDYTLSDGTEVTNLGKNPDNPSWALGALGMPGLTAWAGLTKIGQPKPGETIAVAAATGPVGATVGQIGKILGCRVVGIAGGPEKCSYAVETLGFDACIDHKADNLKENLAEATPDGIDVYFENVGGKVLNAVLPRLNDHARIPVCGLVSQYNATSLPDGPDRLNWLMSQILIKRMTLRGFIVFEEFGQYYNEFASEVGGWIRDGKLHYREEVIDGLENAPNAFAGLLRGENFGKRVIRLGKD
ncbi:NADP-dependent oxidoreductase [Paracoccus sediminicola]|uniref:NADP-dependent oxidoreductase n=1 Tax=Paracoccus sediminicola TaxID=3017783 RepID=UPI0022F0A6B5|nr:NADP-dependent oxidoreductase [Paracoccus sediminicola]WBU56057.1 NADP-dependent oxidoreductase [Paracoccus sediminicola]